MAKTLNDVCVQGMNARAAMENAEHNLLYFTLGIANEITYKLSDILQIPKQFTPCAINTKYIAHKGNVEGKDYENETHYVASIRLSTAVAYLLQSKYVNEDNAKVYAYFSALDAMRRLDKIFNGVYEKLSLTGEYDVDIRHPEVLAFFAGLDTTKPRLKSYNEEDNLKLSEKLCPGYGAIYEKGRIAKHYDMLIPGLLREPEYLSVLLIPAAAMGNIFYKISVVPLPHSDEAVYWSYRTSSPYPYTDFCEKYGWKTPRHVSPAATEEMLAKEILDSLCDTMQLRQENQADKTPASSM